ncbi:hypothetical protein EV644_15021 [Kribbella orskensis]|uniref:Uncharacterized protein n=1 Tax=Kribbella orskensis TaxID=2512216 RepID=A0ABY2B5W4_9ACTN|nr:MULTISPECIES: hypothetical protein [Kribbella]TCN37854.1 hypothetical protein EV642_1103 [Kribbella sp. VKM Ac-2500]TCO08076.1 hypothetical protein EV644_15021 [Kribbella orskensis]
MTALSLVRCARRAILSVLGSGDRRDDTLLAELKDIPVNRLDELMAKNTAAGRGANGRPAWLAANHATVERVILVPHNYASPGVLRCNAAVLGKGENDWLFSVDVSLADFDTLPGLSKKPIRTCWRTC